MGMVFLGLPARLEARDGPMLFLPRAHRVDGVPLVVDHLARGERAARSARARLDELALLHTLLKLRLNLSNRGVAHGTFQSIPQQLALFGDRLTFQIFLSRVSEGLAGGFLSRFFL